MPLVTRFFIRSGLLYLIAALLTGLLLAGQVALRLPPWVTTLTPVYFHLFLVGWVTQLIIGVAYWMFPKWSRTRPRGSTLLAWGCYVLLNLGLLLRVVAEPLQSTRPSLGLGWAIVLAALLQWLGGVAFVLNTWSRVKER
ncbi:MAG: hypothetical protein KDE53_26500 [Caldilineaceae bacterium]|nr:hypothetical protein [Caldilineaceae bacterium]